MLKETKKRIYDRKKATVVNELANHYGCSVSYVNKIIKDGAKSKNAMEIEAAYKKAYAQLSNTVSQLISA